MDQHHRIVQVVGKLPAGSHVAVLDPEPFSFNNAYPESCLAKLIDLNLCASPGHKDTHFPEPLTASFPFVPEDEFFEEVYESPRPIKMARRSVYFYDNLPNVKQPEPLPRRIKRNVTELNPNELEVTARFNSLQLSHLLKKDGSLGDLSLKTLSEKIKYHTIKFKDRFHRLHRDYPKIELVHLSEPYAELESSDTSSPCRVRITLPPATSLGFSNELLFAFLGFERSQLKRYNMYSRMLMLRNLSLEDSLTVYGSYSLSSPMVLGWQVVKAGSVQVADYLADPENKVDKIWSPLDKFEVWSVLTMHLPPVSGLFRFDFDRYPDMIMNADLTEYWYQVLQHTIEEGLLLKKNTLRWELNAYKQLIWMKIPTTGEIHNLTVTLRAGQNMQESLRMEKPSLSWTPSQSDFVTRKLAKTSPVKKSEVTRIILEQHSDLATGALSLSFYRSPKNVRVRMINQPLTENELAKHQTEFERGNTDFNISFTMPLDLSPDKDEPDRTAKTREPVNVIPKGNTLARTPVKKESSGQTVTEPETDRSPATDGITETPVVVRQEITEIDPKTPPKKDTEQPVNQTEEIPTTPGRVEVKEVEQTEEIVIIPTTPGRVEVTEVEEYEEEEDNETETDLEPVTNTVPESDSELESEDEYYEVADVNPETQVTVETQNDDLTLTNRVIKRNVAREKFVVANRRPAGRGAAHLLAADPDTDLSDSLPKKYTLILREGTVNGYAFNHGFCCVLGLVGGQQSTSPVLLGNLFCEVFPLKFPHWHLELLDDHGHLVNQHKQDIFVKLDFLVRSNNYHVC